ncbi:hypothetical protein AMS59_18450 [Lysinibacillus sp. FJAT-14745]|uniref:hypothetical protein n=1 Tax=Lysinibacillus sp. FJAT-14745 TaxID=1704289 RepID=UPI0006ABDEB4|nr:hypothetical protein [Lysinibacillus sp. FJAT-14745]KOP71405.1 hypothetical protein AMS59_18450 [Lysinibacillus sp. FJAT-14745]
MTYVNKDLARTLEQQHKRSVRGLFLKIQGLNNDCTLLRKRLEPQINLAVYKNAIDYVNQFVSHTTILNLKFITNTQNLEVAVLHVLLLAHILENEDRSAFEYEHHLLQEYILEIFALNDHAKALYTNHQEKMLHYTKSQPT